MFSRLLSALIGIPLLLGLTYLGDMYTAFLTAGISLLSLREFMHMAEKSNFRTWPFLTTSVGIIWLIIVFNGGQKWLLPCLFLWFVISFGRLVLNYPACQLAETVNNFIAVVYTVFLPAHFFLLRQLPDRGLQWALLTFFLVWASDTFAYFIGVGLGKHPLIPKVSPRKTVEGFFGGLIGSMAVGLLGWYYMGVSTWVYFLGLALLTCLSAQLGDLLESVFKRIAGIKDSGNLIPGHGGILDRFDSFILAIPMFYYYVTLIIY